MAAPLTGQVSVTGTAAQLSTDTRLEVGVVLIKADVNNSTEVHVGPAGVTTTTGFPLVPGETLEIEYVNKSGQDVIEPKLHELYAVGTASDRIAWIAWRR